MGTAATVAPAQPLNAKRLGLGIVVAVVVNLIVYAVASATGATWIANGQAVGWFMVPIATVVAMAIGGLITWLLARRWDKATITMAWVGIAFAVISVPGPLLGSTDTPTRWALAAMHITTGIVWFVAVYPARSRRVG